MSNIFFKLKKIYSISLTFLTLILTLIVGTLHFAIADDALQDFREDHQQVIGYLVEKGPLMIYENRPEKVLQIIKKLPYKMRLDTNIQILEGFSYLKLWTLYKDAKHKDEWYGTRTNIIYTKRKDATLMLVTFLKDGEPWLRLYAAELLGLIGDSRALKELERVEKNDENHRVRRYASWAYKQIIERKHLAE